METQIKINKTDENENQQWKDFFKEREIFLNRKLTATQKISWRRGTIDDAKKALELRKDLKRFYDNGAYSNTLREYLEIYLRPEYENIEYELNNNGCINLKGMLETEIEKHDNHSLERILKNIKSGYYGDWCIDNDK